MNDNQDSSSQNQPVSTQATQYSPQASNILPDVPGLPDKPIPAETSGQMAMPTPAGFPQLDPATTLNTPIIATSTTTPPAPIPTQDQYSQNYSQNSQTESGPNFSKKFGSGFNLGKLFLGLIIFLLFVGIGVVTLGYFVAYGFVSTTNNNLDRQISHLYMSLPFVTKTTSYILEKSALEHQKLSSANVDLSIAVKDLGNSTLVSQAYGGAFEMQVTGPVEFSDPENPSLALNAQLSQDFNADFVILDKVAYFKLNKIPAILYSFLGLNPDTISNNPLLNRWVWYDFNGLETQAMAALDESSVNSEQSQPDSLVEEKLLELNEALLPFMTLSSDELDGRPMHRLSVDMDSEEILSMSQEISKILGDSSYSRSDYEEIKNMEINLWIDKKTYYMEKTAVVMTFMVPDYPDYSDYQDFSDPSSPSLAMDESEGASDFIQVGVVLQLKDLGQTQLIQAPFPTVDFETYMLEVSGFLNPRTQFPADSFDEMNYPL